MRAQFTDDVYDVNVDNDVVAGAGRRENMRMNTSMMMLTLTMTMMLTLTMMLILTMMLTLTMMLMLTSLLQFNPNQGDGRA